MEHLGKAASAESVRRRLASVEAADTGGWGVLRVDEMLCHVREAFRVAGTEVAPALIKGPLPPAAMKFFALRAPLKWPKTIETVPALKREAMPAPETFGIEKARLLAEYEFFLEDASRRHAHPMFGAMSTWDWQRWGFLHADHHLRQFGR